MHLIDKDPVPKGYKASSTPASEPKKDSLGTAIKNKLRSAAGAPGRAIYNKLVKPHDDLKMDRSNTEYAFLKDYNAKAKRGIGISNVDEAKMQMFRDSK
jgi:hypothetical protein